MTSPNAVAANAFGLPLPEISTSDRIKVLERRCQREKAARQQAEKFLEEKSLELYEANQELKKLNHGLEQTINDRTNDLRMALQNIKDAQKRTEHLALHDTLTGLPNRRYLRIHLDKVFEESRNADRFVAILHIDLDRFKLINDTLGHASGDHVLKVVAQILNDVTIDGDFVARIGGDEFVIVTSFDSNPVHVKNLAKQIPARAAKPINHDERELRIGASVGYAYNKANETAPDKLLVSSDIALYQAKDLGRGMAQEFTNELRVKMNEKKALGDEILIGLEKEEFIPFYQPKICAVTNEIEGLEALVRWQNPKRGMLAPDAFLSLASDIGVLAKIDDIVLQRTIADFEHWHQLGLHVPRFSVNISLGRLMEDDLLERLDAMNLPRGRMGFEVVESIFFDAPDASTLKRISDIKDRGIDIEIDDFGSGHASIIGVVQLHPSTLKIDRYLIQDIIDNPVQQKLVKAIIEIGNSLNLKVVAEGIETMEHAAVCKELGCDVLQGYFFGRPMPCDDFKQFLENWQGKAFEHKT